MGYLGAKTVGAIYKAIIALMPPHDTYIEPFAGSGAIALKKAPARRTILMDKDPAAIALLGSQLSKRQDTILEVCCADALQELWRLARSDVPRLLAYGRVVIYCDPPYVLSTRTSEKRYRHELTDEDHRQLAAVLDQLSAIGCSIIVSGYPSALYDEIFAGWRTWETQVMTRGGVRTEKLWFNFEPGYAHQATWAGENFTRRQNIKRKAERWQAKFLAMSKPERQAVLAALLNAEIPHS